MEVILEIALQLFLLLGEFLFTVVGEGLFESGRNHVVGKNRPAQLANTARKSKTRQIAPPKDVVPDESAGPLLSALAYVGFGALCGVASLWIAPSHFIGSQTLRWLNVVASPLLAGFLLAHWRANFMARGKPTDFTADFINAALLAFALSATRLAFAH